MLWHKFRHEFISYIEPKNISFVYVISVKGTKPYKVGLTKSDLLRRFGNFQNCFRDFKIHMVIAFPYDYIFGAEDYIHTQVPGRMRFPELKRGGVTGEGLFSEWFNTELGGIFDGFQEMIKRSNITPIFGFKARENKLMFLREFEQYNDPTGFYTSQFGREVRPSEKGDTHTLYFDNNRRWDGINFGLNRDGIASTGTKRKMPPTQDAYIGQVIWEWRNLVGGGEDYVRGVVTNIKKKANRKGKYFEITWDELDERVGPTTTVSLKELRSLIRRHYINGAQWLKQVGKRDSGN
jgi:hypothetical protein